ncbi:hypothetical protein GCM10010406_01280 [Streptomyces thermolineatus]|uniref:Uncharacterized protein n=1 Tax=Streptomyces thermolineatus TaxID=44033 RepID=A0ABN3KQE4_9ACTN
MSGAEQERVERAHDVGWRSWRSPPAVDVGADGVVVPKLRLSAVFDGVSLRFGTTTLSGAGRPGAGQQVGTPGSQDSGVLTKMLEM